MKNLFNQATPIWTGCIRNPNFIPPAGLQNYWPFCSNFIDIVTNTTLYNGVNATLTLDRFNNPNSSVSLSNGFLQAPNAVYFPNGKYTIMVWIYPRAFNAWSRVIDFGNGESNDEILITMTSGNDGKPFQRIHQTSLLLSLTSSQALRLNQWQHLAFTFSSSSQGNTANIYMNGILVATTTTGSFVLSNAIRTTNYVGKSLWAAQPPSELRRVGTNTAEQRFSFPFTKNVCTCHYLGTHSLFLEIGKLKSDMSKSSPDQFGEKFWGGTFA